ncbi:MAG: S8 family serine peptidase [bacterium]|nr:S8 family serine peptidase [bacterium]
MPKGMLALSAVLGSISCAASAQNSSSWTQLSLSTCKVDAFLAARPESDGRGVVIAVLDTGVDPSIPGLIRTPDGQVKVVDVQDFSGQGDIDLHRVRLDAAEGKLIDHDDDGAPIAYDPPPLPPDTGGEERHYWFGFFDEKRFINSDVSDLNDNGKTDDRFPICVTALEGDGDDQARCYVDTNLDRSFADEKPLGNYNLAYDTFTLARPKPEQQIVPVTFAINIFLRQAKAVVYYDDGAHGTHVAGIAAGYGINGQDGFNGIAPGAKVMGLKFSQNAIGAVTVSDSLKRSLEHAARYAREHDVYVVCNMSFGVESVIEGDSDTDRVVDEILRRNPKLVFCTSAGNEGPGLSSVGTPAAAASAITVGAALAADSARDQMGYTIDQAVPTVFTSRGGELDKPEVIVPGWSTSTVPRWVRGNDYWAGTSMASPYAAGLCALLISDAAARHPGKTIRACDVRRALCLSSKTLPGTLPSDGGYGLPDLLAAADILDQLIDPAQDDPVIGYDVSTPCPHGHKGTAPVAYWRGTYFPTDQRQTFTVEPVFAPTADEADRTAFVRQFELRCDVPWLKVPQQQVYLRSDQSARIHVEYDPTHLTDPGIYSGAVEALHDGRVAFRMLNTVVVPHRFAAADNFVRSFDGRQVQGWQPDRYFLAIPPGASAMKVTLSAPEGAESMASIERIYDPTGERYRRRNRKLDTTVGRREVSETFTRDLMPGVWEVPVVADRPDKNWPYDLKVRFFGLHADPPVITDATDAEPEGELTVTNLFERPLPADADGSIEGFRMRKDDTFEGLKDELTYKVSLDPKFDRVRLELEMTPEAYATTSDIGVMVTDPDGKALLTDGFSNRIFRGSIGVAGHDSVKVIIRGGFAYPDDKRETPITVKIDRLLAEPVSVKVTHGDSAQINFVPGVPLVVEYAAASRLPDAPADTAPVGYLRFRQRSTGDVALRVAIEAEE